MKANNIPMIESIEKISQSEFDYLKKHGFCYVKIGNEIESAIKRITCIGESYFRLPEEVKKQTAINTKHEGYLNHLDKGYDAIERYVFRGGKLPKELVSVETDMITIRQHFTEKIGLALLKLLFNKLGIEQYYLSAIKSPSYTLSLIYYPPVSESVGRRLKSHEDTVLLTILVINQPGLQCLVGEEWINVYPKHGYVLVNLGRSLEMMTNKDCCAATHRVNVLAGESRFSLATFLAPNFDSPLINYKTGEQYYESFESFLNEHLKTVYPERKK